MTDTKRLADWMRTNRIPIRPTLPEHEQTVPALLECLDAYLCVVRKESRARLREIFRLRKQMEGAK